MNIDIKKSVMLTIIMRLYIALIVGMVIVNAAFRDDDEAMEGKDNG